MSEDVTSSVLVVHVSLALSTALHPRAGESVINTMPSHIAVELELAYPVTLTLDCMPEDTDAINTAAAAWWARR